MNYSVYASHFESTLAQENAEKEFTRAFHRILHTKCTSSFSWVRLEGWREGIALLQAVAQAFCVDFQSLSLQFGKSASHNTASSSSSSTAVVVSPLRSIRLCLGLPFALPHHHHEGIIGLMGSLYAHGGPNSSSRDEQHDASPPGHSDLDNGVLHRLEHVLMSLLQLWGNEPIRQAMYPLLQYTAALSIPFHFHQETGHPHPYRGADLTTLQQQPPPLSNAVVVGPNSDPFGSLEETLEPNLIQFFDWLYGVQTLPTTTAACLSEKEEPTVRNSGEGPMMVDEANGVDVQPHRFLFQAPTSITTVTNVWKFVQRALRVNLTSPLFHRVFPRQDLQFALVGGGGGGVPIPKMTMEQALKWTCLGPPSAAGDDSSSSLDLAPQKLKNVTLTEQHLALRFLQGLCLLVPAQKAHLADSPLFPVVVESMGCALQHVRALAEQQRQSFKRLKQTALGTHSGTTSSSGTDVLKGVAASSTFPVSINPALEAVLIALMDAVEAACHYCPRCLNALVQLHGVKHLLSIAVCPYTPVDLRCAIFDTVSVLMQEVQPFRRIVQAGGGGGAAAAAAAAGRGGIKPKNNHNNSALVSSNNLDQSPLTVNPNIPSAVQQQQHPSAVDDIVLAMMNRGGLASPPPPLPTIPASTNTASTVEEIELLLNQKGDAGGNYRPPFPSPYLMDRATASKFDSAVRDWFSALHMTALVPALIAFRDVSGTAIMADLPKNEVARRIHRANRQREKSIGEFLQAVDAASFEHEPQSFVEPK